MSDAPTSIPWKRLTAEGGAIVLSILLAFAIDASWDERQERVEERETLEALQSDFESNREAASNVISIHATFEDRVARLARMTRQEVLALPEDSVGPLIAALAAPGTFDPATGTVDALIGAGKLGLLREAELRQALTRFLSLVEDAQEDSRYMQQFAVKVWEASVSHGGPWKTPLDVRRPGQMEFLATPSHETLARIHADQSLMGLARQMRYSAWVYVGEVEAVLDQVDRVLELIQASLD